MTEIICPACGHLHTLLAPDGYYHEPFHCASCLGLYFVDIKNGVLLSCEPLTESGYARWQQACHGHHHII